MCDYSLMAVPNRLAQEGEELVTHRFPTGSLGLASPVDVRAATAPRPAVQHTVWQKIRAFFDPPAAPAVCAVCIPPGARLQVCDIRKNAATLGRWGGGGSRFYCGRELRNTYRDAVRFSGGLEVRLQELREGIKVRVVDLTGAEQPSLETLQALG
jgi:hypothetical protein